MSAVTASLCSTLMFVLFVSADKTITLSDQKIIPAESGQDVTLTCRAPNINMIVLEWNRTDLGDKYVLLYQDGRPVSSKQHPSFKDRVDLQDKQMKDGDVSLILKNVTINDAGTYECRVFMEETRSWKYINKIHLHVVPPGQTGGQEKDGGNKDGGKEDKKKEDGSVGLKVGLTVSAVLLLVAGVGLVLLLLVKCRKKTQYLPDPDVTKLCQPPQHEYETIPGQDVILSCQAVNSESEKMSQQLHQPEC